MRKVVSLVLVIGFLIVDFLFFHDVFKPGESTSFAQYLTGVLSIPVFILGLQELISSKHKQ